MSSIYVPSSPTAGTELDWSWEWASLSGPDARDFLHRVTTANTRAMKVGEGAPACFLTAQGKLRAYFRLWNYGEGEYGLELDPGKSGKWRESLFTAIDQYTFAEKMTFTPITGLESRWIFCGAEEEAELLRSLDPSGEPLSAGKTRAIDEEIRICHHGAIDFGKTWITAWGRPTRLAQWIERALPGARVLDAATLETWRIDALRPRLDRELTDASVPLEAGLIDAIAQNKGCYPGQEVIEKIISLGSPAKRLARISGSGPAPSAGSAILNAATPPGEVGQLTSIRASGDSFTALGLIRKNYAKEGLEVRFSETSARGTLSKISAYESAST